MMIHQNSHNNTKFGDQIGDQNRKSIKFTDITIRHIKPKGKRISYWNKEYPGFGIRVSSKGKKTWILKYRFNNVQRTMTLGHYPQISLNKARLLYLEAREKIDNGIDPLGEKQNIAKKERDELTVKELIDRYLLHCTKAKKVSVDVEKKCLYKDIIPTIGHLKISQVEPKQLAQVFHDIIVIREAPSSATHLYSYVRRLFNYAADMGLMRRRDNPCLDIKLNIKKNKKSRHLSPVEIHQFWHCLDDIPMRSVTRLALRFMLVTLARGCEVRHMTWKDINLKNRIWTLPKTKNGHMHQIYLNDMALSILTDVQTLTKDKGYVFGSSGTKAITKDQTFELKPMHIRTLCQPIKRHFDRFGIETPFTPHDLRRTGATIIASLFGRRDLVKMCLNHVSNDVTDIYDQYTYSSEKKMAMEALNRALQIIIESKDVESIPNLEDLRKIVTEGKDVQKETNLQLNGKTEDFRAKLSNPVSYKLSFDHDKLLNEV